MVIKVYISSVTCNNQQRKNQHTILSKLQAEKVDFIKIDVTDPKHNQEKLHMRELSKSRKEGTFAVPPQIFNDSEYCGPIQNLCGGGFGYCVNGATCADYEAFADALETQNLWEFLKMDYGLHRDEEYIDPDAEPEQAASKADIVKDNVKELQDQLKQKIEDDDSLIGFNKEGEEEKKDEEGGEKTREAIIEEEEKVVEEAKEGDEEEKKEEKEEDTKETEADEKTNEEVEKKEEVFADNEQLETQVEESEVMKNAEPSQIVEFVSEESSKISEELARNTLTEVQEFVVKKELPNTLRSLRRIILNEESLAQKYAGPMEQENESKENKEPLEQELLEEVIEEVLQSSSVKCKQAMKCVGREEIQYLLKKEEGDKETEKKIVNDNVCSESVENVNKNREDKEEIIELQNLNERLDEASGVVNYTEDFKNERKDIENIGNLDKREVNEYTELLVDKEFSEVVEPHSDDTNDNVELFEEKVKEHILIGEREFTEDSNLLVEKSDVEDEKTTTEPVIDEEKDITEYSNNLRDRNIYEDKQEDDEMEDISDDDDDKENNQSLQHNEHLDEEYAEDFEEEEMAELQDESDKEQIEKDAVPRDTEYLEKEGEFLDSSLSEVLHTDLARNDSVDNIEGNEKFAQLIPTNSEEGQEQSNETSKEDMEFWESVEPETDFFNKENLSEVKESEESEQKTEIEEKVDKAEEVEEEKKTEESENQE